MSEDIKDIELPGAGPFAIPLLAKFVSLDSSNHPDVALARFEFEDGREIFVPITSQALASLRKTAGGWPAASAWQESEDKTKH